MKTVIVPAHMRAKPGKVKKTVYVKRHKMKVPSKSSRARSPMLRSFF